MMRKSTPLFAVPALLALSVPAQAGLVAGWDFWEGASTAAQDASVTNGVTATATAAGGQVVIFSDGRGGSSDGTFGDLASPAASTTVGVRGAAIAMANGNDGTMTIEITNTSGGDLDFEEFVFDTYARRPNASRTYELSITAGDLTNGVVFTSASQAINHTGGSIADTTVHDEINIDLTGLADATLGAGESVTFVLSFTGPAGTAGGHDLYLDNIGVTAVPEPGSLALIGLGALAMIKRRRKA